MTDFTAGTCPRCGGRLCVETEEPDRVYCDTCPFPEEEEVCPPVTNSTFPIIEIPMPSYEPPPCFFYRDGIREASMRHDELARRKYVKPFKWFKFNRARKATAK